MTSALQHLTLHQQAFLQPTNTLNTSLLQLSKRFFDPLAQDVSSSQTERQRQDRQSKKRKRNDCEQPSELLRMQQLYTDGFDVEQIWQQSRRVLDAALSEVERVALRTPQANDEAEAEADAPSRERKRVHFEDGGDASESSGSESLGEEGVDWAYEGDNAASEYESASNEQEQLQDHSEVESRDLEEQTPLSELSDAEDPAEHLIKDTHGLNDGFFSIDQFNKHTQFLENVDARGDENDGAASDEEDVDWEADPLSEGANISLGNPRSRPKNEDDVDDAIDEAKLGEGVDVDEDEGPTFGDVDLDAPDTDDEDDEDAAMSGDPMGDFNNTNEILYGDFFAPPAAARSRKSKGSGRDKLDSGPKPRPHSSKLATEDEVVEDRGDADMERAMTSVRRDLDDDEEDDFAVSGGEDDTNAGTPRNLSTHERRMAEFRKEIARLERENVASKPWALTGETVAPARPENALLEEDLEFERVGKPLPVITQEVNESIEDLIRRRILNNEFDEVPKRRPELENINGHARRGILDAHGRREELSDTKPQRGLAEEYEDDYLRKTDPNYVDQRSEATKKKHAEIENQWSELRSQLDALCNWHYKPRPPEKNLEVRTSTAVVQMEEARPAAEAGANASGLAPQELYKPGQEGKTAGEIRTKGGTAVSKEEETRESKRRRRRRMKEKAHKEGDYRQPQQTTVKRSTDPQKNQAKKKGDRDEVLKSLKQGNVKIIGKKGQLQDIEGRAATTNAHGGKSGVAGYML